MGRERIGVAGAVRLDCSARPRDQLHRRLQDRRCGAAERHRRRLDRRTRHPLQARDDRAERVPDRPDDAAVRRRDPRREPALVGAPAAVLLPLHARRVRRARRVPRPGPRAVRRLLRPDADPVLLPDRRMGAGARPRESDDQARHLHARRLTADARGGDRDRRAGRRSRAATTSRSFSPNCRSCR